MKELTTSSDRLIECLKKSIVTDSKDNILPLDFGVGTIIDYVANVRSGGKKVIVIGNGGSAAIAQHTHSDLIGAVGVKSLIFTDSSTLTACANDYGYDCIFEKPIEQWVEKGDLLLAISSSGESENILRGIKAGINNEAFIVTFSGFSQENSLRNLGDINIYVPSQQYGEVETIHSIMTHFITDCAQIKVKDSLINSIFKQKRAIAQ